MGARASWEKLFAWWPSRRPTAVPAATETPADPEARQHHLQRLLRVGLPRWSEDPETCDGCGRELLPGEAAQFLQHDDELLLACPLCSEQLLGQGCLHADKSMAVSIDQRTEQQTGFVKQRRTVSSGPHGGTPATYFTEPASSPCTK